MRIAFGACILLCLAVLAFGIHLVLEEERQVSSFSATTTAVVLDRRVNVRRLPGEHGGWGETYEPIVTFQYEVQGQRFKGNRVFRNPFQIGGNLGDAFVRATVDRFEAGQRVPAYYKPDNPAEACLIRRPELWVYLGLLGPAMVLSFVLSMWPAPQAGSVEHARRKGRWIAAVWHIMGLSAAIHYFHLAGADYFVVAPWLFGIYTYAGLIPVAVALPSVGFADRVKLAIGASFLGTVLGCFPGTIVACLADWVWHKGFPTAIVWAAYPTIAGGVLFAVLGLLGLIKRVAAEGQGGCAAADEDAGPDQFGRYGPPPGTIPFRIDERPMPEGVDLDVLLPAKVGPYERSMLHTSKSLSDPIYAEYYLGSTKILVELGICGTAHIAQAGVGTARQETMGGGAAMVVHAWSSGTEPSCFKATDSRYGGAFMAWTRGSYYFSAHAKTGEEDLNRFVEVFPY
jgi:hypothetical protein